MNLRSILTKQIFLLVLILSSCSPVAIAQDAVVDFPTPPGLAANVYLDAPYVQASFVAGSTDEIATETFNSRTEAENNLPCLPNLAVGVLKDGSQCVASTVDKRWGGATNNNAANRVPGGTPSNYAVTGSTGMTIDFPDPVHYVGFWWSAGSFGNAVTFLDSSQHVIAELNADQIYSVLGHDKTLHAIDSHLTYPSNSYYGHPTDPTNVTSAEPFVYVHILAAQGLSIKSMRLYAESNGFEFDNITTGNSNVIPDSRTVLVSSLLQNGSQINYGDNQTSTFTYTATSGGIVTGEKNQTVSRFELGSEVIAEPSDGYRFLRWSDNNSTNTHRTDFAAGNDVIAQAIFAPPCGNFPYSPVNPENQSSPIYLNENGSLIVDKVITGDDYLTDNIDIGFSLDNSENNDQIQIDTNGNLLFNNQTINVLGVDLISVQQEGHLYSLDNSADLDAVCNLNRGFIAAGQTTIDSHDAFVITWFKVPLYQNQAEIFSTFQIAFIKTQAGFQIIRNYEFISSTAIESLAPYATSGVNNERFFSGIDLPSPYLTTHWLDPQSPFLGFTSEFPLFATNGDYDLAAESRGNELLGRYVYQNLNTDSQNWTLTAENKSYLIGGTAPSLTAIAAPSNGLLGAVTCSIFDSSDTNFQTALAINDSLTPKTYVIRCSGNANTGFASPTLTNGTLTVSSDGGDPVTATFTSVSPSSGTPTQSIKLNGSHIAHAAGHTYGYENIYWRSESTESTSWTILSSSQITENLDGTVNVLIPNLINYSRIEFHIDWCPEVGSCIGLDIPSRQKFVNQNYIYVVNKILYDNHDATTNQSETGDVSFVSGLTINHIPDVDPIKTGFDFLGWFTEPLNGLKVTNGSYAPPSPYGVVTLHAHWKETEQSPPGGGGNNNGGGVGGGNDVVIEIPQTKNDPVVITQPQVPTTPGNPAKTPDRKITVSKSSTKTVINIAPKVEVQQPLISVGASNIAIRGVTQGQRIRVTVVGKDGLVQVVVPKSDSELSALVNKNAKATVKIEITPTSTPTLKKKAKIAIDGAKKNQRVRVTVK
jgi:hypothetical protein